MQPNIHQRTRAQESRAAIEKIYIVMRHLFNRGYYKPFGASGLEIKEALLTLSPEIYGSINNPHKVELDGLVYVIDRLPKGIERSRFIRLISEEGYLQSDFEKIVPAKRRRNCYMTDKEQMLIEVTRGRSEIYDILTHLTFLFVEADKIRKNAFPEKESTVREWLKLEEIVTGKVQITKENEERAFTYLSTILGRTFDETREAHKRFLENSSKNSGIFQIIYWLGKLAQDEITQGHDRQIAFSPALRERIGHHIYGETWANQIKESLLKTGLIDRPLHIISANMHSVLNSLYAYHVLRELDRKGENLEKIALRLSKEENQRLQKEVEKFAAKHGMTYLKSEAGTNIPVQIFDTQALSKIQLSPELKADVRYIQKHKPVILVMDYAFGEQAYETMDELLKPYEADNGTEVPINVVSISIMGKAGILEGGKGDIMIPTAHIFEGTADNYPFENDLTIEDFKDSGIPAYEGPMVTVLGTSLQNKDVLSYFKESSWEVVGLEMEGAHYQKAIQAASRIRKSIDHEQLVVRYAYYASDNPLISGSTLASGGLGAVGVKPTYLITMTILEKILNIQTDAPRLPSSKSNLKTKVID